MPITSEGAGKETDKQDDVSWVVPEDRQLSGGCMVSSYPRKDLDINTGTSSCEIWTEAREWEL